MNVLFNTGFEHGMTPVSSGGGLAGSSNLGSPTVVNTASPPYGAYSLQVDFLTATPEIWRTPLFTSSSQCATRFRFKYDAAPSVAQDVFQIFMGNSVFCVITMNTSGSLVVKFVGGSGNVSGSSVAASLGAWHLVDLYLDGSTTSHLAKLTVDGTQNVTNASATSTGIAGLTSNQFGKVSGEALTASRLAWYDDVLITDSAANYPLGDGKSIFLSLGSDGVNNPQGPDCFAGTLSYTSLDRSPFSTTVNTVGNSAISQTDSAPPHNTHFLQFGISPTPETNSARAVTCLVGYGCAAATANNGTTRVRNNDGLTVSTVYAGDMSETNMFFKRVVVTKPLAWTPEEVNGLKAEIGLSSSVANPPIWQQIGFELDYPIGLDEDVGQGTITLSGTGTESYHWGGDLPGTLQAVWQPYEDNFKPSRLIRAPVIPAGVFVDAMSGTIRLSGSGLETYTPPVQHLRGNLVDAFIEGETLTLIISLDQGTLTISTPNRGSLT